VNRASGGSVLGKVYEPDKRVSPKEVFASVSKGQAYVGWSLPGYESGQVGNKGRIRSAVAFGLDALVMELQPENYLVISMFMTLIFRQILGVIAVLEFPAIVTWLPSVAYEK
jgi:hypothetical protein